ncbi:MAG: 1-acyl-sn-glycerol-3-phosphate acyltransferase [Bacteroidales bacterium]|nr:1-acyl-sn-glycerol-3-phosphate acyltransferase [Bacteroidales bacterium]
MELISIHELEKASPLFRGRAGKAFALGLLRMLGVSEIERRIDGFERFRGPDFAQAINAEAGMNYTVNGLPREEALEHFRGLLPKGPFITICNHTQGALDGISLIDFFGHLRQDYKYMVNELLWRFEPLRENLITVTPNGNSIGTPTARSLSGVRAAKELLSSGGCLGLFPSGAVSDLKLFQSRPEIPGHPGMKEPRIRDREWQMSIIKFIRNAGVPVLPLRLLDGNSRFYYSLGLIDWRLRLLRLPSEMLNKSGKTLRILAGNLISPAELASFNSMDDLRAFLRASVYSLK